MKRALPLQRKRARLLAHGRIYDSFKPRASIGQYRLAPRRDHKQVTVSPDVAANNEVQDFGFLFGIEGRCLSDIA